MKVKLDNLDSYTKQIIITLLRKTGLKEIPNEFTIVREVNDDAFGSPDFYRIELSDGRKFGLDFIDYDWNDYEVIAYKWTKEPVDYDKEPILDIPEIIYKLVTKKYTTVELFRDICDALGIDKNSLIKKTVNAAKIEVCFKDIDSNEIKKGYIYIRDNNPDITFHKDKIAIEPYVDFSVVTESKKYCVWHCNDEQQVFTIKAEIEGIVFEIPVSIPKNLEGFHDSK